MAAKGSAGAKASSSIEQMSFEAALKELEDIVSRLEQGEVDLEDSITFTNAVMRLKRIANKS